VLRRKYWRLRKSPLSRWRHVWRRCSFYLSGIIICIKSVLRVSGRWPRRLLCSKTWGHEVWYKITDVSEVSGGSRRNIPYISTELYGVTYLTMSSLFKHLFSCRTIKVTERLERRHKQILDDLKETRGYCTSEEEALDRTVWGTSFWRGYGPVVRQTADRMNDEWELFTCIRPLPETAEKYLLDFFLW